jgi:Flp pilus assembly protein TadB
VNDRLRIGDADREAAARELGEHFALGRISVDEHTERLEQIWTARTAADLAPAFRDLPRPRTPQPSRPARRSTTRPTPVSRDRGWDLPRVPFLFKLLLAVVVVWWGFHHPLFLLVAAVVWFLLVRRFVRRRLRWWHGRAGSWERRDYSAGWH